MTKHIAEETATEQPDNPDYQQEVNASASFDRNDEHQVTVRYAINTYRKAVGWCLIVSMATIMESYDTYILGSFYAYPSFQKHFGEKTAKGYQITANWQLGLNVVLNVFLIIGGFLNGWLVERVGAKKVMIGAHLSLMCFIFVTFFAPNLGVLLVGQALCGIPWGIFASLAPAYAAEVCPLALRPYLTVYVNLCWVIGHLIGAGVLRGLVNNPTQWSWRLPFALQWIWPPFLAIALLWAPESPWWLVKQERFEEAKSIISRLYTHDTSAAFSKQDHIDKTVATYAHTIQTEKDMNIGTTYTECFRGTNRYRTEIACVAWGCQVLPGFAIQNYITYFFTLAGVPTTFSYKLSIGVFALAFTGTSLSFFLQRYTGRRTIYIWGLAAMVPVMFAVGCLELGPGTQDYRWAQASLLLIWFFIYGLTIGPIPYAIAAEVPASRLRVKTIALGRNTYYLISIINSVVTPYELNPSYGNLKGKAGFVAAAFTLCMLVWAFFRLPETKGRSYEELDVLFDRKVPARRFGGYEVSIDIADVRDVKI